MMHESETKKSQFTIYIILSVAASTNQRNETLECRQNRTIKIESFAKPLNLRMSPTELMQTIVILDTTNIFEYNSRRTSDRNESWYHRLKICHRLTVANPHTHRKTPHFLRPCVDHQSFYQKSTSKIWHVNNQFHN